MSEQDIKTQIITHMRSLGFYCDRMQSGKLVMNYKSGKSGMVILADKGTPDLVACCNGDYVAIEVKKSRTEYEKWQRQWRKFNEDGKETPSNERSIAQHKKQNEMMKRGVKVLNVYSIDGLEQDLRTLGYIS